MTGKASHLTSSNFSAKYVKRCQSIPLAASRYMYHTKRCGPQQSVTSTVKSARTLNIFLSLSHFTQASRKDIVTVFIWTQ